MISNDYEYSDLTPRQRSVYEYVIAFQQEFNISPSVREICKHFGLNSPGGVHRILSVLREKGYIQSGEGKKRAWQTGVKQKVPTIPLLGTIAAGTPIEALENIELEMEISPNLFGYESCFGLRVTGDSMIEAHIQQGDIAIIRPQNKVENGEVGAVIIQEDMQYEATLKKIYRTRTSITLEPANSNYSARVFKGYQRKYVSVIGRMVGLVRSDKL